MTRIGTARWTIPKSSADAFPRDGRHLERYAALMRCVEINSSFHRPHRPSTYERWAATTPSGFRFSAKLPKTITHKAKLVDVDTLLDEFLVEVAGLGDRLAVLLVQLPPSLQFDESVAGRFFASLRERTAVPLVCEPRHATWFTREADASLVGWRVGRAAADPARTPEAARPGGWLGPDGDGRDAIVYYRWHGSPRMYWSAYEDDWLAARAGEVARWSDRGEAWCLFDNTSAGAALDDALRFDRMIATRR